MGGFAKLKEDFEKWFPALDVQENWKNLQGEMKGQAVFRHLYLRCLFEIAGNLDTIALCSRALVEQSDRRNKLTEVNQERFEHAMEKMLEATKELISRPAPVLPTIPMPERKVSKKKNAG